MTSEKARSSSLRDVPRGGSVLAALVVALAILLGWVIMKVTHTVDAENAVLASHVKARQCGMASMRGRLIETYRCDVPNPGEYVEAGKLYHEAMALGSAK